MHPVTRGCLLLVLFGLWSLSSVLLPGSGQGAGAGRRLLTVSEEAEAGDTEAGHQEAEQEAEVEVVTGRVDILPPSNGSQVSCDWPTRDHVTSCSPPIGQGPCVEPAVKQFPSPLLGRTARQHGGVALHVVIAVYMFIGRAHTAIPKYTQYWRSSRKTTCFSVTYTRRL